MTELWLVRHGETDWNRERRVQGSRNIGLNALGRAQAAQVAARFEAAPPAADGIVSSDLDRALDTARPTAASLGLAIRTDAGLRERSYGVFEGLTFDEFARLHPEASARVRARDPDFPLEGGESLRVFQQRVLRTLRALADERPGRLTLVFTHSGVLDMAYRHINGLALDAPRDFPLANVSINRIALAGDDWRILDWGDVGHLVPQSDAA